MVTALDEAIGNLTTTFKELGLYENSVIWFSSDNGGPLPGANNFPLRGGKFTNWEGGTRVRSFIHSPNLLPKASAGVQY
jgi:arylsulfatase A-like enzyme